MILYKEEVATPIHQKCTKANFAAEKGEGKM